MQVPLTFERPLLLFLIPILGLVFWVMARRSWSGLSFEQKRQSLVVRILVASLIVLSLSGPHFLVRTSRLTTLFLLDVSQSIRPDQRAASLAFIQKALQAKKPSDEAGLIVFGKDPYLEIPPSQAMSLNGIHAAVSPDSTNIQAALQAASSAFPSDTARRIVLLTDGNENVGSAADQIAQLNAQGTQVDIAQTDLSAKARPTPEALIDDLILPQRAHQDAPFTLRVVLSSTVAQRATLRIDRDGKPVSAQSVLLKPGKTAVVVTQTVANPGFHRFDAQLVAPQDTLPQNNQAYGFVSVVGKPRILYVADSADPSFNTLQRAMAAQSIQVDIKAPTALSTNVAALETYDSIVFGNVAATEFSADQMQAINESVRDFGVGFGMIGGEHSYAAGSYQGTPIEEILPVSMDIPKRKHLPATDVVIVLDASGSMSATENGIEKVQLAARAAIRLMGALQPQDRVAVVAVTETPTLIVPLESPAKAAAASAAIESLSAGGGGIYCRTGLEFAYSLLEEESNAAIKHVIICPDTTDSEQQEGSIALAANMQKDEHITTSVCGIGEWHDPHVPYQRALAQAGGGQLFVVDQASDLPSFFQRDVQMIQESLFVEKPFLPLYDASDSIIAGIPFPSEPPLLGYNLVTPKPGADVALTAPDTKDPIFAHWQYGLGRTFAFMSDDRAHWAAHWLDWPGYTQFWSQVLRWSLRPSQNARFQAVADSQDGHGRLVVDAFSDEGGYVNNAQITARIAAPDLGTTDIPVNQTGPGRYEASFDAGQTGAYLINISQHGSNSASQTIGLVVPYSPEFKDLAPNTALLALLARQTNGRLLGDPSEAFRQTASRVIRTTDLAPALLLLAALFFLLDVAWRRLGLRLRLHAAGSGLAPAGVGLPLPVGGARAAMGQAVGDGEALREPGFAGPSPVLPEDEYLSRPASSRLQDEDDSFPFVASLPRGRQEKPHDPSKSG